MAAPMRCLIWASAISGGDDVAARLFGEWSGAPALMYGVRLWAAVCLALFVGFWLQLDNAYWAGATAATICQPVLGASLRKGWFRLIGTIIGAIAAIVLSACFAPSRAGFLLALALWGSACAFAATLLRNFASYAAALAGITAAIIVGGELGAVGGINDNAFSLALARATEIGVGIISAGLVLAMTDLGGTRQRLSTMLSDLSVNIAVGLMRALGLPGTAQSASRRGMIQRVSGLDAVIDQAAGEIGASPFRQREWQAAAGSLFVALTAWRSVASHLELVPDEAQEATRVRECLQPIPTDLDTIDPRMLRASLWIAVRRLVAFPADTSSQRLLCDRTAAGLLALRHALSGVMQRDHSCLARASRRGIKLCVPDMLPALINSIRAFLTIGAAALIWIWTAWPGGVTFIVFATITITLFAPREDAAFASARAYTIGATMAAICTAIVAFALLPLQTSFVGLCFVLGLVLVSAGALSWQSSHQPMFAALGVIFVALLRPSNPEVYDPAQFYNTAFALLPGVGLAMLAMRLLPPMLPTARARRLLVLTLRDLRRLALARPPRSAVSWNKLVVARLSAIPDSVDTLQAARLTTALSVGTEIIRLRQVAHRFGVDRELAPAMAAIAAGDSSAAIRALSCFEDTLAAVPAERSGAGPRWRARGTVRSITDSLIEHDSYFDAEVRA
jgi:uncharacterized membrane protein YccC